MTPSPSSTPAAYTDAGRDDAGREGEAALRERLERIEALEQEIKSREKAVENGRNAKKQVILRLSPHLWNEIAAWAEEDFRSINGQIEYLLTEAVRKRKGK